MPRITAERLFTGEEWLSPGFIEWSDGVITEVGPAEEGPYDVPLLIPGLVDVHNHGGGGASFSSDPATALSVHRATGTTTLIASLVTESIDDLVDQVRALGPLIADGEIAGIHLEGPWLSQEFHGAHSVPLLRDPSADDLNRVLDAGEDTVRMVTIAPEREGGVEAVATLVDRGVVAALGHTAATYDEAKAAVEAGATGATHLFNAMRSIHHRAPGPVIALLEDERVWYELIADGVHLHPALVSYELVAHPERVVLITDAMSAAGYSDGEYQLGALAVSVVDGVARVQGTDTIAGSTLLLAHAVANALSWGVDETTVFRAATANPADYLGLAAGRLRTGGPADAVVWADGPERVLYRGNWLS